MIGEFRVGEFAATFFFAGAFFRLGWGFAGEVVRAARLIRIGFAEGWRKARS